jgi:hypothetical protein
VLKHLRIFKSIYTAVEMFMMSLVRKELWLFIIKGNIRVYVKRLRIIMKSSVSNSE